MSLKSLIPSRHLLTQSQQHKHQNKASTTPKPERVCVYVCIVYMCVYVCHYVHLYIYIYIYIYIYKSTHIHTLYKYTYTHTHIHTNTYTYIYTYAYIYCNCRNQPRKLDESSMFFWKVVCFGSLWNTSLLIKKKELTSHSFSFLIIKNHHINKLFFKTLGSSLGHFYEKLFLGNIKNKFLTNIGYSLGHFYENNFSRKYRLLFRTLL